MIMMFQFSTFFWKILDMAIEMILVPIVEKRFHFTGQQELNKIKASQSKQVDSH